jgi:hypothetical protein
MKISSILAAFVLMLLIGAVAGAEDPPSVGKSNSPANTSLVQVSTTSPEFLPNCLVSSSVLGPPVFSPAPTERATAPCGPCSASACQGLNVGDVCAVRNYQLINCVMINWCGSGPGTGKFCDCSLPY